MRTERAFPSSMRLIDIRCRCPCEKGGNSRWAECAKCSLNDELHSRRMPNKSKQACLRMSRGFSHTMLLQSNTGLTAIHCLCACDGKTSTLLAKGTTKGSKRVALQHRPMLHFAFAPYNDLSTLASPRCCGGAIVTLWPKQQGR